VGVLGLVWIVKRGMEEWSRVEEEIYPDGAREEVLERRGEKRWACFQQGPLEACRMFFERRG
jgi:hypothetical protein